MKTSRTKQIEQKYGVKLHRENTPCLIEGSELNYVITFQNGKQTCEWLTTLDAVEKYLNDNPELLEVAHG